MNLFHRSRQEYIYRLKLDPKLFTRAKVKLIRQSPKYRGSWMNTGRRRILTLWFLLGLLGGMASGLTYLYLSGVPSLFRSPMSYTLATGLLSTLDRRFFVGDSNGS